MYAGDFSDCVRPSCHIVQAFGKILRNGVKTTVSFLGKAGMFLQVWDHVCFINGRCSAIDLSILWFFLPFVSLIALLWHFGTHPWDSVSISSNFSGLFCTNKLRYWFLYISGLSWLMLGFFVGIFSENEQFFFISYVHSVYFIHM